MANKVSLKALKDKRKQMTSTFPLPTKILGMPAPYISYVLIRFTNISANQLSLFWLVLGMLGMVLIAFGSYGLALAGVIIAHFAMMLDQVDGDIARARKKFTVGGPYLDEISQVVYRSLLLFVVGVGLFNSGFSIFYLYAGAITAFVFLLHSTVDLKIRDVLWNKGKISKLLGKKKNKDVAGGIKKWEIWGYLRPAEPGNLIYIFLIFNFQIGLIYLLTFYLVLLPLLLFRRFYNIYKKVGNLSS